jgi:putative ABC transport system permease protein
MFLENLTIALRAIRANKMRSVLTVLGVMIGVAAVIAVVSIVQGLQYKIAGDLNDIGSNFIQVFPDTGNRRNSFQSIPDLTIDDAAAVRQQTTAIRAFTPIYSTQGKVRHGDAEEDAPLYAVSAAYQDVVNRWVEHGRFFTPLDEEQKKRVCTVGLTTAKNLKLGDDPIGKEIRINNTAFTVVGVMEKKGAMFGGDQDELILIPFATAAVLYGNENMRKLVLAFQMRDGSDMELANDQVREVLRRRHHIAKGEPDDFRILAQEEILKTVSKILLYVTLMMAGAVGIALLVGGVGIMNIMLVSVTERTREIGIRKATGARRRDIMLQFLIEAITLAAFGGIIGIIGGWLLANLGRWIIGRWTDLPPVHTPLWAILIATGFCALLGVLFGILPAARASRLDPIEALRYE